MSDDLRLPERREMPRARKEQRRAHLVRELRATGRSRRLGRPLIIVPAVLALVASGAFAATRILDNPEEGGDYLVVDCYERASLRAPSQNAVADLLAPPGGQPGDRTPGEMCGDLWDTGELGEGRIVPPLAACLHHREVAVFPGGPRTCGILGLRELPAEYQVQASRFTEFFERGADILAECTTPAELDSNLRALNSEFGRDPGGVSVSPEPLPGRDCVGGYPRPLGLFVMLTAGSLTVEEGPMTHAERQRERREQRRTRDERDYYIEMVLSLRYQICGLEELVPPAQEGACLADFERDSRGVVTGSGEKGTEPRGDVTVQADG
jgi:hypothetical protein